VHCALSVLAVTVETNGLCKMYNFYIIDNSSAQLQLAQKCNSAVEKIIYICQVGSNRLCTHCRLIMLLTNSKSVLEIVNFRQNSDVSLQGSAHSQFRKH